MSRQPTSLPQRVFSHQIVLRLVAFAVFANGLLILVGALLTEVTLRRHGSVITFRINLSLFIGLTLIYLSSLLMRRKQLAWLITIVMYVALFASNIDGLVDAIVHREFIGFGLLIRVIVIPLLVVGALLYYQHEFTVKSDIQSFAVSLRFVILILLLTFLYGVLGFTLLDVHDFHQEVSFVQAAHYTVDQFDLTTQPLHTYTRRGRLFLDSLSLVSVVSLGYAALALFQPLRARFTDQSKNRYDTEQLLRRYGGSSEDFFKLWPHDKVYVFSPDRQASVAFHVQNGVALAVGDPAGKASQYGKLLQSFLQLCETNDWLPAFIHTEPKFSSLFEKQAFTLQKIGEEAVVTLAHFDDQLRGSKYFRQIQNKFDKQGYTTELLQPPHNQAVIERLHDISNDWLQQPGRSERGLMMGYFSAEYVQLCPILVARDAAGTIQAFINNIPSFDPEEANFDLLRHSSKALGNVNDYLLMNFMSTLRQQGYERLNLGLSPLTGLDDPDNPNSPINSAMKFVYSNGDRFYSFSGLYRFKAKYEPSWQNRYIAYRGGIRGFTRTINALNRAMNASPRHRLGR